MQHPHAASRESESEAGFTLIELMMVVLIIAILIAIATPTFMSATSRVKDRAVQSNLRNATTGAKGLYLTKADYTLATPAALTAEIGGVTFVTGSTAPTSPTTVSPERCDA